MELLFESRPNVSVVSGKLLWQQAKARLHPEPVIARDTPWDEALAPAGSVCARLEPEGAPAKVITDRDHWTSVFLATPILPKEQVRMIYENRGVALPRPLSTLYHE